MEKFIAFFETAHGPQKVNEIVEFRTHSDGRPIVELQAEDGGMYLVAREALHIREVVRVPVTSIA